MHDFSQFDPQLVQVIAAGEPGISASFQEVEEIAKRFHQSYYMHTVEIPRIEKIEADGGSLLEFFQAELFRFNFLQGHRIAEHLADLVCEFNRRRLLACALALRAVLEVAGAISHYVAKIEQLLPDGDLSDVCDQRVNLLDKAVRPVDSTGDDGRRAGLSGRVCGTLTRRLIRRRHRSPSRHLNKST